MNPEQTQIPGQMFDLKELRAAADGNEEFMAEMVQLFIRESGQALREIKIGVENGDYARVRGILHKMKPSIMVMGIHEVGQLIAAIEAMDLQQVNAAAFSDLCSKIEGVLRVVNDQMGKL
jgi:HPt (histidine-containing phosphotransfer) domain-containing protein